MSELSRATAQYISNREMGVDRTGDRKGLHLSLGEASPTPQDVPLPFGGLSSDVGEVSICCSTSLVLCDTWDSGNRAGGRVSDGNGWDRWHITLR